MNLPRHRPDAERFSVLMALILLAYATARYVRLPVRTYALELPGVFLPLQFNINTVVSVLVAGLAATGADWLLSSHPEIGQRSRFSHWLIPGLTAWIISLPLANLPPSPLWWLAFASGALVLTLILQAEYVSVDPADARYTLVSLALSALAYGMFLTLAISLKALGVRLLLVLPALATAAFLISMRVQQLRALGEWRPLPMLAASFLTVQIAAALHYWPLSAVAYGLALLGLLYALNSLITAMSQAEDLRTAAREPLIALAIFWLLAAILH
jgi:hypothetical protein